jgi:hypothetical protein
MVGTVDATQRSSGGPDVNYGFVVRNQHGQPACFFGFSVRPGDFVSRMNPLAEALDCRTHHCLAQPLPPPRQGLGEPEPQRARLPQTRFIRLRVRSPHAPPERTP